MVNKKNQVSQWTDTHFQTTLEEHPERDNFEYVRIIDQEICHGKEPSEKMKKPDKDSWEPRKRTFSETIATPIKKTTRSTGKDNRLKINDTVEVYFYPMQEKEDVVILSE